MNPTAIRESFKLRIAYDEWHEKIHRNRGSLETSLFEWHQNAFCLSPPLKALKVLEVGCGTGDFSFFLRDREARVTAVDFSEKAIELSRKKAQALGHSINFQVADAHELPFKANSFDLIFSCECLEHVFDPQCVLNEFHRVLKPSGKLILTTVNYTNALILSWIYNYFRRKPMETGTDVQPRENLFFYWQVKNMLCKAGFQSKKMIGSSYFFLLLPRFNPQTFFRRRFKNSFFERLLLPTALHIAFEAVKE